MTFRPQAPRTIALRSMKRKIAPFLSRVNILKMAWRPKLSCPVSISPVLTCEAHQNWMEVIPKKEVIMALVALMAWIRISWTKTTDTKPHITGLRLSFEMNGKRTSPTATAPITKTLASWARILQRIGIQRRCRSCLIFSPNSKSIKTSNRTDSVARKSRCENGFHFPSHSWWTIHLASSSRGPWTSSTSHWASSLDHILICTPTTISTISSILCPRCSSSQGIRSSPHSSPITTLPWLIADPSKFRLLDN